MTLKHEIQKAENQLAAAIADQDSAKIVDLYTDDARLMPHGVPTLYGKKEIQTFFDRAFKLGIVEGEFLTNEVEGFEDRAVESGTYQLFALQPSGSKVIVEEGRYLVIWKRVDGRWLYSYDIFNSER